ncbi:MAG: hypothetical protein J6R94_05825, partial [Agathobacter sp.]|nr:hypothetical protein [Agathobacter sp.]
MLDVMVPPPSWSNIFSAYILPYISTEIDTYFADGSYTADRNLVDVSYENMVNLVTGLNEELKAAGLEYVASFVLVEDAEGNLSIVLRMNIQNENYEAALQTIVMGLTSQSYVAIGDQPFVDGGVYMNAFIQAFLNSGLSTQSLEAMIDENGDIQENFSLEGTIITDTVVGIPNADAFGGLLAATSLSISKGEAGVPMYITLQDHDQNPEEYKQLDKSLQEINQTAVLEFANGAVNVIIALPQDSFELYMGAMLLEGYLNLEDFHTPTFVEMKEYLDGLFLDTLIQDSTITGETVANTTDKLGIGADTTSSPETIDGLLASLRDLFDEDTTNGEAVEKNEEQQDKDLYKIEITYPTLKIATDMGLSEGMAELLRGDMVIPVNARLANCNEEYKSVVLDFGATELKDMVVFDTTNHATTTNHNGMVVALADLESVIANGTTYVNLNGHTITTLVANAKVTVFDTKFNKDKAGSISNFGGEGEVILRGGDYDRWDVSNKLPSGFVQEDGYVSNVYYDLAKDENGNFTINLKAETLGLQSQLHMQEIALSIFADLALCGFTWAGVTMEGEETYPLYGFAIHDLLGQWGSGTAGIVGDIVDDMDNEAISAFLNNLLAKLTDFDAVAEAIDQNKPIIVYDLYTYAWDVEIVKAETENMLTANIKKGTESKKTLTIAVIGDESEKEETKNLYEELDHIFGGNKGKLDILVDFHSISIQPEHGFGMDMNITANVAADLS